MSRLLDQFRVAGAGRSPLKVAVSLVERTLGFDGQKLTPAEMAWLYERPTLWLRALFFVREGVHRHGQVAAEKIKKLRGDPSSGVTDEYRSAKAEYDRTKKSRSVFLGIVEKYIEEVKAIVGPHALHAGDVIEAVTRAAELIDDGDTETGLELLLSALEKWEKPEAGLRTPAHLVVYPAQDQHQPRAVAS